MGTQVDLARKVRDYIHRYSMIGRGDVVAAGISGGADSVCLLCILAGLRSELGFTLRAVHVHHGLRSSADFDEEFVQGLCARLGVALDVRHVRADEYAAEHRIGTEEAGRILRYRIFEEILEQHPCPEQAGENGHRYGRVATAHHMDDQAETVLFHLCRGSGIKGMAGILPVQNGRIRPLLGCTRQEIEDYLRRIGQTWCTDETNGEPVYARNRLRNEILPLLNSRINEGASRHIAEAAEEFAETEIYLRHQTDTAFRACTECRENYTAVNTEILLQQAELIRRRVIYRCICGACGHVKDITRRHVDEAAALVVNRKGGTGRISLPDGAQVFSVDRMLYFIPGGGDFPADSRIYPLSAGDYIVRVLRFDGDLSGIPRGAYKKWFDYDKIDRIPYFRTRRAGDRIAAMGGGTKKVARCMIDRKIPEPLRDRIVMPALDDRILWIPGGEISREYLVTEQTERVLEIGIITA